MNMGLNYYVAENEKCNITRFCSTNLQPCLIPDSSIAECPWSFEEQHDGNQGVEDNGEDQGDEVEEGDVSEEHGDVHCGVSPQSKVTFRNLKHGRKMS